MEQSRFDHIVEHLIACVWRKWKNFDINWSSEFEEWKICVVSRQSFMKIKTFCCAKWTTLSPSYFHSKLYVTTKFLHWLPQKMVWVAAFRKCEGDLEGFWIKCTNPPYLCKRWNVYSFSTKLSDCHPTSLANVYILHS